MDVGVLYKRSPFYAVWPLVQSLGKDFQETPLYCLHVLGLSSLFDIILCVQHYFM